MTDPNRKRKTRNDILLIAGLLLIALAAGACLLLFQPEGDTVTVTIDGAVVGVYPLSEDRTEDILTAGEEHNLLVIRQGKAWVESATCPDGICADHRPIHRNGESIVCLPHKVVITVSVTADGQPDIVV